MKWVAAVLLILNVLIFLGISDRQVESVPGRSETRPDVNRESMLLIKEVRPQREDVVDPAAPALATTEDVPIPVDDPAAGDPAGVDPADDLPATVLSDDRPALLSIDTDGVPRVETRDSANQGEPPGGVGVGAAQEVAQKNVRPDVSCYRVGPFREAESWNAAVAWVEEKQWQYEQVRSESRELRAVRVYIGPYESIASSQSTIDMLKEKELDHFIYLREGKARISLGYFTQEELAAKYVEYLNGQGIDARSQPEYRTLGPFDWMDVTIESRRRRELLDRQWKVDGVNTTEQDCEVVPQA